MRFNLSEWALRNQPLVRYLIVVLMFAGVWAYSQLGQKEDPEFTFKAMAIQVQWPGASTEEMEQQVTDKIEKKLQEMGDLEYIKSYTKPGETQLILNLKEGIAPKKVPDAWYTVRKKIGDIRPMLPADIKGPFFNDEFGDTYGNIYAFTGDGFSHEELRSEVEKVRQEVLRLSDVGKTELIGKQDERIYITLDTAKLAAMKLDSRAIWAALADQNAVLPSGIFHTNQYRIWVRPTGTFTKTESIQETPIAVGNKVFRLGDVAKVSREFVNPATFVMRFNGQPALGLAVSMRDGGDVLKFGDNLKQLTTQVKKQLPVGVEIHAVSDQPKVVKNSVNEFMRSLIEAVVIVLAVSFFSLGLRTGIVVALSIPLVLAMTFLAMYFFGIDLQRISLGSLIIALGLLVDDAIIAVEMMSLKLEQGWNKYQAATFAYTSTAFPMLTGTLITAATFLPVGLAKSNAGEYVFSLFAVVSIALVLSWVVAVIFTPYLGFILLKTQHHNTMISHDEVYNKPFYQRFKKLVTWCLEHRKMVIAGTFLTFALSIVAFKTLVTQQFFPASNRVELMVDMWLPQSASFEATRQQVAKLEKELKGNQDIVSYTSYIGAGSPRFYLPLDQQMQHVNFAQLMIMTHDEASRERLRHLLQQRFHNDYPMVRARVTRLENGPPVGYPIQFRVMGSDHQALRVLANKVEAKIRANPSVKNVNQDWGDPVKVLRLNLDQSKIKQMGLSSQAVAKQLNLQLSGMAISEFREADRTIAIVPRLNQQERTEVSQLANLMIQLPSGAYVPLSTLASVAYGSEEGMVWRRNHQPTITIRADPIDGVQASDISKSLWKELHTWNSQLALGYHIELGGSLESSEKSQQAINKVVPLMLVVVLTLLMLQLKSFQRTLMVLLTAPLGMIGVTLSLIVFAAPFGFVAMLGVIALSGMIMRNSVILVDQIEQDIESGIPAWDAIIGSTVRRFRPIMLTALAAILAMIPLTRSTFWGPMAVAIMGGLFIATVLTLLFLPALYAQWFGVKKERIE